MYMPLSIGNPTGGGGCGGGGVFCATQTKLIKVNKIEANMCFVCNFIAVKVLKKASYQN